MLQLYMQIEVTIYMYVLCWKKSFYHKVNPQPIHINLLRKSKSGKRSLEAQLESAIL